MKLVTALYLCFVGSSCAALGNIFNILETLDCHNCPYLLYIHLCSLLSAAGIQFCYCSRSNAIKTQM